MEEEIGQKSTLDVAADDAIAAITDPALSAQAQIARIVHDIAGRQYKDPAAAAEVATMIRNLAADVPKLLREFDFHGARRLAQQFWHQANPLANREPRPPGLGADETAAASRRLKWHPVEIDYVVTTLLAKGARAIAVDERGITIRSAAGEQRFTRERIRNDSAPCVLDATGKQHWNAQFPPIPTTAGQRSE